MTVVKTFSSILHHKLSTIPIQLVIKVILKILQLLIREKYFSKATQKD